MTNGYPEIGQPLSVLMEGDRCDSWRKVKLGDVTHVNPKRVLARSVLAPFVPMADVREHRRSFVVKRTREYKGGGARFRNGDTLLARITPCLENGKTALVTCLPDGDIAHGSTEFIVLSAQAGVTDPLFVYYLARSPRFRSYAINQMTGTSGRQRVPTEAVKTYTFLLPPLEEQQRIAHVLGTFDDKIELNRRMNETLEEMGKTLFKSWFVDFDPVRAKRDGRWRPHESLPGLPADLYGSFPDRLVESERGPIPEHWEVGTLGQLCRKPQYGYTQTAKQEPVGPKFLRITDINKTPWIEWESVPHCEITPEDFDKYCVHPGDVLIARIADPGHGCLIEEKVKGVFASYLIRFRPLQERYGRFLQYWLRSDGYWDLVQERGVGTTRLGLNAKVLSGFPLTIPADSVLDAFRVQIDKFRSRIVKTSQNSNTLGDLRDTLLSKLLTGELRLRL